jgi:hypothetical protein
MSQKMRENFKSTKLLTSQWVQHGLLTHPACQAHLINYLETGEIGFEDGETCGAPPPPECELLKAFGVYSECDPYLN